MKIYIPDINGEENFIENKKSIILIGANGSGKTRMSIWIDEHNNHLKIHRISAQKSLNMPDLVRPSESNAAEEKFLYGDNASDKQWLATYGKKNYRWGNHPEIHLLNDFEGLMEYLVTENYEKSIEYREIHKSGDNTFNNETKLEKIKQIWENVILHRKLKICAGKIEAIDITSHEGVSNYNGSQMSDGERAIFYFIGQALCAPPNSLIIIDEPENHLHKSILVRLWNAIEASRPDCSFLYITHNLDFASSRLNTQIIWVKHLLTPNHWDYELIDDIYATDNLLLEVIGNRQKVLFVEGTPDKSIDRKLYAKIFPEYNIIPLESCNTVIQTTKAYNHTTNLHYSEIKGIIDRDRRTEEEVASYKEHNIFIPTVAEVENLFLLPEVIEVICQKQNKDNFASLFEVVQAKTFDFLETNLEQQALLFTQKKCQNAFFELINKKANSIESYKTNISTLNSICNIDYIYTSCTDELHQIIDSKDFLSALKVINNKGLLPYTQLPNEFGWKKTYYIDYVLRLLDYNDETSTTLKNAFKHYIELS